MEKYFSFRNRSDLNLQVTMCGRFERITTALLLRIKRDIFKKRKG
jgi:hypothetical protein